MLRTGGICRYEWQVQVVFLGGREGDFGLLRLFFDALHGIRLFGKVDAGFLFKVLDDPIHEAVVPIVSAEMGIAISGGNLEDAVADFKGRDIKCATAEVVDSDFFIGFFVQSVSERSGCGLVDDALDFEARDLAGILRGITLGVVEVSGNRNDGFRDLFAQFGFGIGLELGEDHCGNFRRRERLGLSVDFDLDVGIAVGGFDELVRNAVFLFAYLVKFAAHETLHGENCVCRIRDCLSFCGLADKTFAGFCEGNNRRGCACALGVFQNDRLPAFHHRHARIGGSQINS